MSEKLASVESSYGGYYLDIAGIVVAMEGDDCRHMLPEEAAKEIPKEELERAMIGDKKASELPLDIVRFFRGQKWDFKSLSWAAKKINEAIEKDTQNVR